MDSITKDETTSLDTSSATDAFLKLWKDPQDEVSGQEDEAKATTEDETPQEADDTTEEQTEDQEETPDTPDNVSEKPKATKVADDDDEIITTVDGVEQRATVKEVRRLLGQEAALTKKSQAVAAEQTLLKEKLNQTTTVLSQMVQRAEDKYRPYAELDMLKASRELSPEEFAALRDEQIVTYNEYKFVTQELDNSMKNLAELQQQEFQEKAQECIKTLTDPTTGIEGWNQALYDEIRVYAKGQGMSASVVDTLVDPSVFKILHKAMKLDNIKTVATTKKASAPKKVLTSTVSSSGTKATTATAQAALSKLKSSGSREDAANAFLSKWEDEAA